MAAEAKTVSLSGQAVSLTATSRLSIRDAHFLTQDKGKVLAYTVVITNNSSKPLDLIDYWLRVKTKSGKSFKSTVIDSDKDKVSVAANTSLYLTYYAIIDSATKLNDLAFEVVKWDFSAANYEKRLGTISYPAQGTDQIKAYEPGVILYNGGKLKGAIKQAYLSKDKDSSYVTINYLLENVGKQAIDLSKAVFNIQTQSQTVYTVSTPGLDGAIIQPGERKIFSLRATIPASVSGTSLSLVMSQNDEISKVYLPAGVFGLPSLKVQAPAASNEQRVLYIEGQSVNTKAGKVFLNQGTDGQQVSLEFNLSNNGNSAVAAGGFDYFLVSSSGTSYALTYTKDENATLLPGIPKTLSLSGSVPNGISLNGAQLLVKTTPKDKEKSYVVGSYLITTASQEGELGTSFSYNDYSIKLNSVTRLPSDDQDTLVANFSVRNTSSVSKQVPALGGYFLVNGVKVGTEHKAVILDQTLTLAPGASYEGIVYTSIPYSTSINKISFVCTEPATDKAGKVLYQFTGQQLSQPPVQNNGDLYQLTGTGKSSTVGIKRNTVLKGEGTQTFYVELEATNKELRAAAIAKLGGYIVDKNGLTVPVQFADLKDRISPGGKALLLAWATLPKAFDAEAVFVCCWQTIEGTQRRHLLLPLLQDRRTRLKCRCRRGHEFFYRGPG